MINNSTRFADLECLLFRLGFRRTETAEKRLLYEHSATNSLLLFPAYQAEDIVAPHHYQKTRWQLDSHGLMEGDAFDQTLENELDAAPCLPAR